MKIFVTGNSNMALDNLDLVVHQSDENLFNINLAFYAATELNFSSSQQRST